MKKNKFIHLHGLFLEVANYMDEHDDFDFDDYDALDVDPMGIHLSKSDHQEAVDVLLDSILDEIDDLEDSQASPERVPATH